MTALTLNDRPRDLSRLLGLTLLVALALATMDGLFGTTFAQPAAGANQVFTNLSAKTTDLFYNGRTIILIVCAIAIIITMVGAISGRFPMQKAIVIAGAIFVIGVASSIVTYFASPGTQTTGALPGLTDTDNS